MTVGLFFTAFFLGLRHGVDWDHIAAIADLTSAAEDRRRGYWLSFLYAVGHAAVVLVLGALAIVASASIPSAVDEWMGRIVGLTLIWLGVWVLVELVRHGRDFRLRSRWMLVLGGTFAGIRRVLSLAGRRVISVDHDHDHEHQDQPGQTHEDRQSHDHAHLDQALDREVAAQPLDAAVGAQPASRRWWSRSHGHSHGAGHSHSHQHRHTLDLPNRADGYGTGTATGIGVLHGIGVESPTQIAVFVASTSVVGTFAGLMVLVAWVVGLIAANTVLAVLAGLGLLQAERNFTVYCTLAVLVAIGSIVTGALYLGGIDALPEINL